MRNGYDWAENAATFVGLAIFTSLIELSTVMRLFADSAFAGVA